MNNFIPKHFIQEILEKTNIIDLINTYINIKKYGKNYQALCPFHNEKTPSFIINYEKQYFYCFGCNIYGNTIDFLMKYNKLTFIESIEELAYINGLKIPYKNYNKHSENIYYKKQKIYKSMHIISMIYYSNITKEKKNIANLYLKQRNINEKMITKFNIGYSKINQNILKNINDKYHIQNLIDGGVISINKQGYQYDRFQGRITFPIKNKYGKIIGFGGRTLNNKYPKYINSPTTNIFNKSEQLYGINEIQNKFSTLKYLLVVEGYFDVISLTQFDIKNVVSTLGTATTIQQIQMLFRISNCIIYCYDGDIAGKKAAWKTLIKSLLYLNDNYSIKFIFLPNGEDPDSIIHKEGKKKFILRINNAINMLDFFFKILLKKINLNSLTGKTTLVNLAVPLINKIPSKLIKYFFRKKLGIIIGIIDPIELKNIFHNKIDNKIKNNQNKIKPNKMRILISLLIQNPKLSKIIPHSLKELQKNKINGLSFFLKILNTCNKYDNLSTGKLIEFYRDKKKTFNIINKLAYWNNMIDPKKIQNVFLDLISNIYNIILEKKYYTLINKDRTTSLNKQEKYELWIINKSLSKK